MNPHEFSPHVAPAEALPARRTIGGCLIAMFCCARFLFVSVMLLVHVALTVLFTVGVVGCLRDHSAPVFAWFMACVLGLCAVYFASRAFLRFCELYGLRQIPFYPDHHD